MIAARLLFAGFALLQSDTLTVSQVKADYALLFPCSGIISDSTVKHHPLGPFVREVWYFQAYLRYASPARLVGAGCDRRLRSDSVFNASILPGMRAYIRQRGGEIVGVPERPKRFVTWDEVMRVASRFFYADHLREDGSVARYICGAKNGVAELGARDLTVEAFAYAAVFTDLTSDESQILPQERTVLERIAAGDDLSPDSAERILTIRQHYYEEMARNPILRQLLETYYQQKADHLPFLLGG